MHQEQHPLVQAMQALQNTPKMEIKGKPYTAIASRIEVFRRFYPEAAISTEILINDEQVVVVKSTITHEGKILGTGHAEEVKGAGLVNSTSALENCETSSIGRALATIALHGGEFASFEEVSNAIRQQQQGQIPQNNTTPQSTQAKDYGIVQLQAVGLNIENNGDEVVVIGNSYGHQTLLKQLKYKWRPENKQWYRAA